MLPTLEAESEVTVAMSERMGMLGAGGATGVLLRRSRTFESSSSESDGAEPGARAEGGVAADDDDTGTAGVDAGAGVDGASDLVELVMLLMVISGNN